MYTIIDTRDNSSMIPRTGQVAGCGTVPAGKAVTVWGTPTRAERDLGVLHGTYRVKVTDPADPDWHVGTWLMNFQPADWATCQSPVLGQRAEAAYVAASEDLTHQDDWDQCRVEIADVLNAAMGRGRREAE